jgi:dihydrodipicolinate synthase/N-acetylneuraminate lyase
MLLEGVFAAVPTPFQPDGRPQWHNLERNVERYCRAPLSGVVVLGSTGEAVMLNDEETRDALRVARNAAADDRVLIAGVGHESLVETLRRIEHAASLDYDVALVRTPHFYRPQYFRAQARSTEMLTYYRMVADASALPVLLYSIPAYTTYDLPVEMIAELSAHPNIYGIKDSSGKPERIAAIVSATASAPRRNVAVTATFAPVTNRMLNAQAEAAGLAAALMPAEAVIAGVGYAAPPPPSFKTRTREVGFQVLCGSAQTLLPSLTAGATGGVLAMASFAPQACAEIYMAWKDRDVPLAEEKQHRIVQAADVVCGRMGIPGVKYACDRNGYYGGSPRLPLLPLTAAERDEADRLLADVRH